MQTERTLTFVCAFDPDAGHWIGLVEEIPSIVCRADSQDAVIEDLRRAVHAAFEAAQ